MITLIRPPIVFPKWSRNSAICPPIGTAYVAAGVREAGFPVKIIDSLGEDVFCVTDLDGGRELVATGLKLDGILSRIDPKTSIFGISCMFSNEWPLAYRLIEKIKHAFPDKPIIVGGEHVTSVPEFTLNKYPAVDVCVMGEGEETLVDLIQTFSSGGSLEKVAGIAYRDKNEIKKTVSRKRIKAVDDLPVPAWDLIPLHNYLDNSLGYGVNRGRSMPLLATRGCPYQCTFCSNPGMWTTTWIARDAQKVINEIKTYIDKYQATNIDFYDLTAVVKKEWIIEFCNLIIKNNMKFTWQLPSGTRSEALDGEVSYMMSHSGCKNITYAPESGSPKVLNQIKKRVNLDRLKDSMRGALSNDMMIKINIIMGFPDETHLDVWKTLGFIAHCALMGVQDCEAANFSPYPGSELFHELQKVGKIGELNDEYFWNLSVITSVFKTVSYSKHVSSRALKFYLLFGLSMFYTLSFLSHPLKIFKTFILNPLMNREETRFEKGYHGALRRFLLRKSA